MDAITQREASLRVVSAAADIIVLKILGPANKIALDIFGKARGQPWRASWLLVSPRRRFALNWLLAFSRTN